ncbi:hypothetical protein [Streptomyces sp. NPDC056296]|uniref:hypothetical protein n=1 Tax=Streptomyces sp. NPDC056296 TaxID=3345775 RepID=UPI0035E12337
MDREATGGLVSGPALHDRAESASSGQRGEFVGAGGELLLLLAALLLGFRVSLVGGDLVLDDGVGLRVVRPAGGNEQLRDALPLSDFGRTPFVVGQVLAVVVDVLLQPCVLGRGGGHAGGAPADRTAADLRPVDRLAGRGRAGSGDASW